MPEADQPARWRRGEPPGDDERAGEEDIPERIPGREWQRGKWGHEPGERRGIEGRIQEGGPEREPFLAHGGGIVERSPAVVDPDAGEDVVDGEIALEGPVQREVQHPSEIAQRQHSGNDYQGGGEP